MTKHRKFDKFVEKSNVQKALVLVLNVIVCTNINQKNQKKKVSSTMEVDEIENSEGYDQNEETSETNSSSSESISDDPQQFDSQSSNCDPNNDTESDVF